MIILETNDCLSLIVYNNPTFIDVTFGSVSYPFLQGIIATIQGVAANEYASCVHILASEKVVFEKTLINAVAYEIPKNLIMG
ncbi:hypothetical protein HZS_4584 [Henneguya salminicola]|nr:hypothetical protein HZS_4584 [Henneguya salminicola]